MEDSLLPSTYRFPHRLEIRPLKPLKDLIQPQKRLQVTALVNPVIFLDPTSGPVGTSVDIAGAGFDPGSTITIEFDGSIVATETATPNGGFTTTFMYRFPHRLEIRPLKPLKDLIQPQKRFSYGFGEPYHFP